MNCKKNIWALAVTAFFAVGFANCSDWTEAQPKNLVEYDNTETARPESYYKALREYKATDHSVSFGWYSGWGEPGVTMTGMLSFLPDSMDLVSLWSNSTNLSPEKIEDLRFAQDVKGIRVMMCTFIQWIGKGFTPPEYDIDEPTREAFWGWVDGDEAAIKGSMVKYAQAISDTIHKYGYNGLDIDFEPNVDGVYGKLDQNKTYVTWFLDILKDYLGPKSTSGKMLVIDGELWEVPPHAGPYFDYFIAQAYSVSGGTPSPTAGQSETNMDRRLNEVINTFKEYVSEEEITKKFIVTENLESAINCLDGGYFWTLRNGVQLPKKECPSLLGMARWQPANGFRKGGFGGYRFDAEAVNKPAYKWLRTGIQAQNPAVN